MITKNGKIVEATRNELWENWYKWELFETQSFPEYLQSMKTAGVKIIGLDTEDSTNEK